MNWVRPISQVALIIGVMSLPSCGQSWPGAGTAADAQDNFQSAYDKAFRTSFRESSIESCITSAHKNIPANIDVTPYCTCVTDRFLATKTDSELLSIPEAEIKSVSAACFKAHPMR